MMVFRVKIQFGRLIDVKFASTRTAALPVSGEPVTRCAEQNDPCAKISSECLLNYPRYFFAFSGRSRAEIRKFS